MTFLTAPRPTPRSGPRTAHFAINGRSLNGLSHRTNPGWSATKQQHVLMTHKPRLGAVRCQASIPWKRASMATQSKQKLRVLQWNTLADGLAQHGDFLRVSEQHLEWEARGPRLLRTLTEASADVVCLQEVNRFDDWFLPHMRKLGYDGYFCPKPASPCERYGFPVDGCALFYRRENFEQLSPLQCVCYATLVKGSSQRQVLQVAHLKDKRVAKELFVVSTHLKAKANPESESLRREQVREMLKLLSKSIEGREQTLEAGGVVGMKPAVIVCGDFNDVPQSSVIRAMLSHPLGFQSAYPLDQGFTTWKFRTEGQKKATIDYIWYAEGREIGLESSKGLASAEIIGKSGLPSEEHPSDHLALVADFEWLH